MKSMPYDRNWAWPHAGKPITDTCDEGPLTRLPNYAWAVIGKKKQRRHLAQHHWQEFGRQFMFHWRGSGRNYDYTSEDGHDDSGRCDSLPSQKAVDAVTSSDLDRWRGSGRRWTAHDTDETCKNPVPGGEKMRVCSLCYSESRGIRLTLNIGCTIPKLKRVFKTHETVRNINTLLIELLLL